MSDPTFVCIDDDAQEFVPFDDYVQLEVARVLEEVGRMCDSQGAPAGHPLRDKALAHAAELIEIAMRRSQAAQVEAYGQVKH